MVDFKKLRKEQMAKALTNPKKQAKKKGGALVSMAELEKMYAVEAVAAREAAPVAGGRPVISTRGEQFQIGENLLPDELEVIVVAEALLNVYFDSEYDQDNPTSPACFAVTLAAKGADATMVSHESSPNRQGGKDFKCQGCEMNQFGSAERGKGKACANKRSLAVVFANDPAFGDGSQLTWGVLTLPPTSLADWGKFVAGLERVEHRPPHGVITRFAFDRKNPDANKRKRVIAIGYQKIADAGMAMKVMDLRNEIIEAGEMVRPLPVDNYVDPEAPRAATVARGKAKAKTKATKPRAAPAQKKAAKKRAGF